MSVLIPLPRLREPPRRPAADVPYLLISPPLTDPASPYHSISYLVAPARAAGFTGYRCLDANIDALNFLAEPGQVARLLDRAAGLVDQLGRQDQLTRADELRYQAALAGAGLTPGFAAQALAIFRDPAAFYHYPTYRQAVMAVNRWLGLLSLDGVPAQFDGFGLRLRGAVSFTSQRDLADQGVIDALSGPFLPYVTGPFRSVLAERAWEVIGFSVNYVEQLPVALRLAREARARCPQALIVFGGTEICDDVKYLADPDRLWQLFGAADVLVPGEGESPLLGLLTAVRDGRPVAGLDGVLTRGTSAAGLRISYEDVAALPAPAYDIWDWGAY